MKAYNKDLSSHIRKLEQENKALKKLLNIIFWFFALVDVFFIIGLIF